MKTGISWLDVKLGARMLIKYPGLALVGGVGMAVAIAIGAGFFNATAALAGSRLPLDEGDRIVSITTWDAETSEREGRVLHDFAAWRGELRTVRELGAFRSIGRNLIIPGAQAEQVIVAQMTASGFRTARVRPLLGRHLVDDDEREGAPPVVVIGYDAWRTRFGGDPGIVGRDVRLGNGIHTVVGVMPEGFAFPVDHGFWTPLRADPSPWERRTGPYIRVFGRLAPGATLEQARAELAAAGARTAAAHPRTHARLRPRVLLYTADVDIMDDMPLWQVHVLRLLVSMLLVVVCVNVAILVYARTATRQGEIAVRSALGASRRRIVAQLFAEALVLAGVAAAVGLVIARIALDYLVAILPEREVGAFPYWIDFGLSLSTVLYVAALALAAAVIVGVVPALQATGRRLQSGLRQLGGATGMRLGRTWTVLIVAQVALAVAVLPPAVYSAWQWIRYGMAEPGFRAEQFLVARLGMDRETPPSAEADAYQREAEARYEDRVEELVRRVEADPAVAGVTMSRVAPGKEPVHWVEVEGVASPSAPQDDFAVREGTAGHQVRTGRVDADFFRTYAVPVLAGRPFGPADRDTAAAAVVVNQGFVREVLGGGGALGRRVRYVGRSGDADPGEIPMGRWYEIVGVVSDFPNAMEPGTLARVYHPLPEGRLYPVTLSLRVRGGTPAAFSRRLGDIAMALDPTLRLGNVVPLDQDLRDMQGMMRVTALAIGLVTLSVLLLSAGGIYALMSFTVTQRRREIGIRTALGAHPGRILGSVFARAARQLAAGVAAGVGITGLLELATGGEVMGGQGYLLLPGVALLMTAVGLLAAWGPARRGLRIQPMEALREE
jgi:putative ABC transport system permease protein